MDDDLQIIMEKIPSQQEANALMERLFVVSEPEVVFGEPVSQGEYTAITAREVTIGVGFGYAGGGGTGSSEGAGRSGADDKAGSGGSGYGGGGGGGGSAAGRPVAVIEIGPSGVRVEPIVDPTKIAIAMFTTLGSMGLMLLKMLRRPSGD